MFYQFFIEASSEDKTKTSKGLLLLFMIGFLPIFVGIEVKEFAINLPWLINAGITQPERFTYFHCFAVTYAVYRHFIINKSVADCFRAKCFHNFLKNKFVGSLFINKYIFSSGILYSTRFEENEESFSVEVCGYSDSEDLIPSESFKLTILPDKRFSVCFHGTNLDHPFIDNQDEWGAVFHIGNVKEYDNPKSLSAEDVNLKPGKVTKILTACSYLFAIKTFLLDVRFIDFYSPIILNLCLVYYIAISAVI